jgi:hypothetical protein
MLLKLGFCQCSISRPWLPRTMERDIPVRRVHYRCPPLSIGGFEYHGEVVGEEQMTEPQFPQGDPSISSCEANRYEGAYELRVRP